MAYSLLSGLLALSKKIDIIANNIANAGTTGFKSEHVAFEQYLNRHGELIDISPQDTSPKFSTAAYTSFRGSFTNLSQGPIEITGNPLDIAIHGDGFFVVRTPDGEAYTRSGNFKIDEQQRLVTQDNHPVMGSNGEIVLNGRHVEIGNGGHVLVDGQTVARLRVVSIPAQNLKRVGNLFASIDGSANFVAEPSLQGGALEASNVNSVRELTDLMITSRMYDSLQRARESEGDMDQARNRSLGTVQG